jgi:hypothetical protein
VEEERLRLDGRPGRRRLTPGRTAGEDSESGRMAAGERRQQRDARVRFGMIGESGGVLDRLRQEQIL